MLLTSSSIGEGEGVLCGGGEDVVQAADEEQDEQGGRVHVGRGGHTSSWGYVAGRI